MTDKKVALVTGALGGIGTEICNQFLQRGYRVVAGLSKHNAEREQQWLSDNGFDANNVRFVELSVTDHDAATAAVQSVIAAEGRIDALVNNAGITRDTAFKKMTFQQWCDVINTNLVSLFTITQPVFLKMLEQNHGRIINITSVNGLKGQFGQTNYSAAKAGMIGFTKALALEGARNNVCVNAVAPGYTGTPMVTAIREDVLDSIKKQIPLGRLAESREIAAAVLFLAGDDGGYITGETISINGGLHMH